MNMGTVWFLLGRLLMVLTVTLLVPGILAAIQGGAESRAFFVAAVLSGVAGVALQQTFSQPDEMQFERKQAFILVALAWGTASVVGAIPYIFIKGPQFAVDALFESASGFTTTGATILTHLAGEPPGLILWRSMSQWLGGMGIIVLGIAILPKLAVGGMELLGAEAPGPIQEKLTPRIAQTAKALWGIYVLITFVEFLALMAVGMGWFDAVNHALATMSTGGFSTLDASVGGFGVPAIEWVITIFMAIAAANFALHFHLLRGHIGPFLRDREFRFYAGNLLLVSLVVSGVLWGQGLAQGPLEALRLGSFQAVSMATGTGFGTTDFDRWPEFTRALLFMMMFIGGCAGSTGGSIKVIRIVIVFKTLVSHLKRFVRPRAVLPVRLGTRAIPEDIVSAVVIFVLLYLVTFAVGGLAITAFGIDLVSAFSASAACLGNVGPGFGLVGAAQTYAPLPAAVKLILATLMIVGRLELFTAMVLVFLRRR